LSASLTQSNAALVGPADRRRQRRRLRHRNLVPAIALLAFMALVLSPVFLLFFDSLRSEPDIVAQPVALPTSPHWSNYSAVIKSGNYFHRLFNTLIITGGSVLLITLTASLAAWAIVRHTRPWTRIVFNLFIVGLTIPIFVILTPLYILMRQLHLLDSFFGLILIYTAIFLPFAVFFYASFIKSVPVELEQAAAIDGAGLVRTYWSVILPLLRPATATLAIFMALNVWNDLIVPLIFLTSDSKSTVTLGIFQFVGTHTVTTSSLGPAVVLGVAPLLVIFLILQRYIIGGITAGTGK